MILFPPLRVPWDRYVRWLWIGAVLFLGFVLMGMGVFVCMTSPVSDSHGGLTGSHVPFNGPLFVHEMIGQGPLSLRPVHAYGWVARLAEEVRVMAYDSRPDTASVDAQLLLHLNKGKEQVTVFNGKSFYLKESDQGKGLRFSTEPTGLWARPIILDGGSVLFEVVRKLNGTGGEAVEEKAQFIAVSQGCSLSQHESLLDLKGARAFPSDLVLQQYGGKECVFARQAILEIHARLGSYALAVSSGDYLAYERGEWRQKPLEEMEKEQPIAYVRTASEKGIELDIWDEKGFSPLRVVLDALCQKTSPFGPEALPSAVRLRTGTQVSCSMGKRRLILKQGDWLLKMSGGWRHLRGIEDISRYLDRRLQGDLFIFDKIEKEASGRCFLLGHLFDGTRTYMQPVSVPIHLDKPHHKLSKRRRLGQQVREVR